MDISVIICSYNREDSLRKTLTRLCDLEIPPHLSWELLLVDNNSTDGTRQVCESFIPKLPVRYLFEPLQGVNRARNRAVAEAAGQLLLFTDDDVNMDRNWIAAFASPTWIGSWCTAPMRSHPRSRYVRSLPANQRHWRRSDPRR